MTDFSQMPGPNRTWPGDFKEHWKAEIATDGFRIRRLFVSARVPSGGPRVLVAPLTFVECARGTFECPAALIETREEQADGIGEITGFVQAILDAGWDAGMRPAGARDATEELKAVRGHLEDLRTQVFGREKLPVGK